MNSYSRASWTRTQSIPQYTVRPKPGRETVSKKPSKESPFPPGTFFKSSYTGHGSRAKKPPSSSNGIPRKDPNLEPKKKDKHKKITHVVVTPVVYLSDSDEDRRTKRKSKKPPEIQTTVNIKEMRKAYEDKARKSDTAVNNSKKKTKSRTDKSDPVAKYSYGRVSEKVSIYETKSRATNEVKMNDGGQRRKKKK